MNLSNWFVKANSSCRTGGFTLLEMMAAVAILAVASTAVFFSNSAALTAQSKLEEKTVAQWALANQSAYFQLAKNLDSTASSSFAVISLGTQRVNLGGYDMEIRSVAQPSNGGIEQIRWDAYRLVDSEAIGPIRSLTTWSATER